MPLLRLTQTAENDGTYRVELALEGDRLARQTADARFELRLTPQDEADLRWYLEDYLQWPQDPAPEIAARVEERMTELGTELFRSIFQANDDARDLWATLRRKLADTRVEIVTGVQEAASIPWELLRDPAGLARQSAVAHPDPSDADDGTSPVGRDATPRTSSCVFSTRPPVSITRSSS